MFSFLDRIVRGPEKAPGVDDHGYVLGLRWTTHSRAEQNELEIVEHAIRDAALPDIVLDKVENGVHDVAFWLHTNDPKRAFKELSKLPVVAERMNTLQAAFADRQKMKFSILWPKGGKPAAPHGLG